MRNLKMKGAALITVLFITAIMSTIATVIAVRIQHLIQYEIWLRNSNQIVLALQGVKYWGVAKLFDNKPSNKPIRMGPIQYHNVTVKGALIDQQGLFNMNLLMQQSTWYRFVRLVRTITQEYSKQRLYLLAETIRNRGKLGDITQLLTIPNFPTKLYRLLKPYITALPTTIKAVNVNTASAPVLMSMSNTIRPSQAQGIVACVKARGPFRNLSSFNAACVIPLKIASLLNEAVFSRYYLIVGEGKVDLQQRNLQVLVHVIATGSRPSLVVIWQAMR